ncbi:T-cell surface glycoprotein CD8 alpha chain-like [Hirundo rustica]|uniref:T-cell surface glycoprotein CD8 alpha chain-like n=1 Tax=Hirundo rustica TaxID=43150 RepID=UPI001A94FF36|nr:T-cell surface glycoprotein CD8 alpha chain-like [Hirundo rustica]
MDTAPALLLLLTLAFCCPGVYGQSLEIKLRSPKDITQLRLGQKLELECRSDRHSGAYWIHQDKSGSLHFIVFISSTSRATFEGNQKTSPHFEAWREHTSYHLAVKSFTPQDEGSYFCVAGFNQMLYFSPGQLAFLPATTVVAPTMCGSTPKSSTTEEPNLQTPDPAERTQEDLDFFCHIFIWVPLAGACLLLLIALAITIVLRQQTRRRRCRCKRPANEESPRKPRAPK